MRQKTHVDADLTWILTESLELGGETICAIYSVFIAS